MLKPPETGWASVATIPTGPWVRWLYRAELEEPPPEHLRLSSIAEPLEEHWYWERAVEGGDTTYTTVGYSAYRVTTPAHATLYVDWVGVEAGGYVPRPISAKVYREGHLPCGKGQARAARGFVSTMAPFLGEAHAILRAPIDVIVITRICRRAGDEYTRYYTFRWPETC